MEICDAASCIQLIYRHRHAAISECPFCVQNHLFEIYVGGF